MCLILDANKYGAFINPKDEDMEPIRKWINSKGRIVYSPTEELQEELGKSGNIRKQFFKYREAGKMKIVCHEMVRSEQHKLQNLQSDDSHIIALAIVAEASLLVSGDKKLHKDFKKYVKGGHIYQTKNHEHLLTQNSCS